jgi:NADP-dependent 3-hydroxy acid dehydrogenase YdfG
MTASRTALVTGASRGIGLAVATVLANKGWRVAMIARGHAALRDAAAAAGHGALPLACDVADARAVGDAANRVLGEFGGAPQVLVNGAGVFTLAPLQVTEPAAFDEAIEANLAGPFRLVRAFLPAMLARGTGHVVSIGSIADHVALPGNAGYAASKFGLRGLHEVLRAELIGTGVRSTLVSPGPVDTAMWDDVDPDRRPGFTPRARMLRPEAVAAAVVFAIEQPADVNVDEIRIARS